MGTRTDYDSNQEKNFPSSYRDSNLDTIIYHHDDNGTNVERQRQEKVGPTIIQIKEINDNDDTVSWQSTKQSMTATVTFSLPLLTAQAEGRPIPPNDLPGPDPCS